MEGKPELATTHRGVTYRTAQIVGGRLVLNKNLRVKEMFDQDRDNRLRMAEGEWPKLVQRHGKGAE